ncbi:nicotinate-nucleotide--dimethylbenzimidazole phosphoribosyltransferase [Spirochaetota bacterium]
MINRTIEGIGKLNEEVMEKAQERLNYLLKPPGSLGRLEDIARQLAGITGEINNEISKKTIIVMGGDNGILEENVSSYPGEVSLSVAQTMVNGISGVAVLAKYAGADLKVVDLGLNGEVKADGIINRKIRNGTSNFAKGPAMTRDEAVKAIETGIEITNDAIDEGARLLGTGEIGIGNTTTSSAILYAFTKGNLDELVGRGAGITDEGLEHKKEVILRAVELNKPDPRDPIDVISKVGGFDIAGLTGCYLAAAAGRVPIVIDGFISGVAAVCAYKLKEEARDFMLTSHVSVEPGTAKVSEILGLAPMLDMNMRLGEGTGCALAFNIIEAATKMMNEMGTFRDIGM